MRKKYIPNSTFVKNKIHKQTGYILPITTTVKGKNINRSTWNE